MNKQKVGKVEIPLDKLLKSADASILKELIKQMTATRPNIRRECITFLKKHIKLPKDENQMVEAEEIFSIWEELEPDLAELDEYGGGDESVEYYVSELLEDMGEKLKKINISSDARRKILDCILPYIRSGNAGMDDDLYETAYAACHDNDDLRYFAEKLEQLKKEWPSHHTMRIYREIGDNEKYLSLRKKRLIYGNDYHDLATFYWENNEKKKAVKIAQQGLMNGEGRKDELRDFLSARAKETGDRKGYLELQFAQATERLTLSSYMTFQKICSDEEWKEYESKIMSQISEAWDIEQMKIHLHRQEYEKAIALFEKAHYPTYSWGDSEIYKIAAQLEDRYPEQILSFYKKGLGNLNESSTRKAYIAKAKALLKVRHMLINVMKKPEKWEAFAKEYKSLNSNRPAFQEEFAKIVPGWKGL